MADIYITGTRPESDLAVHPGELLAEELEVRGLTQKALAEVMARPAQAVNEIIRGKKAITADTALQLEIAIGTPAYVWLNLQSQHDLVLARRAQAAAAAPRPTPRTRLALAESTARYGTPSRDVAKPAARPAAKKPRRKD